MTDNTARPCTECKWFASSVFATEYGRCINPKNPLLHAWNRTDLSRGADLEMCGPEGKWFEGREG